MSSNFDIYDDLDDALLGKDVEQQKAEEEQRLLVQQKLVENYQKLEEEIQEQLTKEKERNNQLQLNFSIFTETAQSEIKR